MVKNFLPTRLYIKKISNVFYFGKYTGKDIESYTGSGIIWKKYIKKFGKQNIQHIWHSEWYENPKEIEQVALQFSEENDIVNSESWANIIPENGIGLVITDSIKTKISEAQKTIHAKRTEEEWQKIIEKQNASRKISWSLKSKDDIREDYEKRSQKLKAFLKNNPRPKEQASKMHEAMRNKSEEEKQLIRKKQSEKTKGVSKGPQMIVKCTHCNKSGGLSNMKRWHFDNCRENKLGKQKTN